METDMFFDPPDTRKDYLKGTMFSYDLPGWQKCPVCDGNGKVKVGENTGGAIFEDCPTCKGKRIIDKLNGNPPK